MVKKHRTILHPKIVEGMHNHRLAKGFMLAGVIGFVGALVVNPSVTGAAVTDQAEVSSAWFFSSIVIIISFMMVWTGIMIHLMKKEKE